jgi:serine/threonine protein kinase
MEKLKHKNIVELKGTNLTKSNFYVITEYCDRGDLNNYLR